MSTSSRRGNALAGCLAAIAIVLIILAIAAWVVATNWRGWMADGINQATVSFIEQSDLPADEKPEMIAHVNAYTQSFEAGDVTFEQFGQTMEALVESPLIPVGMLYSVNEGYIKPSQLTPEEKQQGERAIQRVARGIHEGRLPPEVIEQVLAPVGYTNPDGEFELNPKESAGEDALRQVIANAEAAANEAEIPDEAYVVDLSDQLAEILETGGGAPAPAPEPAPQAEPEPEPVP